MSESAPKKPREFVDKPVFRLADPASPVMYSTWSNMADGLSGSQGDKPSVLPGKSSAAEQLMRRLNEGYNAKLEDADIRFYDALDELKTTWKRMNQDEKRQEYRHIKAIYDGLDDISKQNYAPEMDYLDRTKSAP